MTRLISRRRLVLLLCASAVTATVLLLRYFSQGVLVHLSVSTKVVNLRADPSAEWEPDPDSKMSFIELWGPFNSVRFSSGDASRTLPCNGFYSADKRGRLTLSGTLNPVQYGFSSNGENLKVQFAQRGPALVQVGFPESPGSSLHALFQIPNQATGRCEMCRCHDGSGQLNPDSDFQISPGSSVDLQSQGVTRLTAVNPEPENGRSISLFKPFAVGNLSFVERRDGFATPVLDSMKSTALIEGDRKAVDVKSLLEVRPRSRTRVNIQKLALRSSDLLVEADGHMEALVVGDRTEPHNLIPFWWFAYGHPWINLLYLALTWVDKAWDFVKKNLGIGKEVASLSGWKNEKQK